MKRNEIIFIIVLLAIGSFIVGVTAPTKIPFLKFWESQTKAAPDGKGAIKLDENGVLSGIPVSAEAASPDFALFINGRLGASGAVVDKGIIPAEDCSVEVTSPFITNDSAIFVTAAGDYNHGGIWVHSVTPGSPGSFVVSIANKLEFVELPFWYLVIN